MTTHNFFTGFQIKSVKYIAKIVKSWLHIWTYFDSFPDPTQCIQVGSGPFFRIRLGPDPATLPLDAWAYKL